MTLTANSPRLARLGAAAWLSSFSVAAILIGCPKDEGSDSSKGASGGTAEKAAPVEAAPKAAEPVAGGAAGAAAPAPAAAATALKTTDVVVGKGDEAVSGKMVTVHYTGTLTNGTKFDSSVDRGEPFKFKLGAGDVIQGWDKGIVGMKVGGKRKLEIPPDLGYGPAGSPPKIPENATLLFDVELLGVN